MRASPLALILLCALAIATILIARLAVGPADLYEKDQPKTLAYTADVLVHGRLALPRDVIYQPATKPPLYNWIAAGVMLVTRSWSELAMKSPSVLGAIGVAILLMQAGSLASRENATRLHRLAIGTLAAAIFFTYGVEARHASTMRLLFLARPDMLQAFFVTAAWLCATRVFLGSGSRDATSSPVFERGDERPGTTLRPGFVAPASPVTGSRVVAASFWLCVSAAILTKGPLGLLVIVYAILAAKFLGGSWSSTRRLHPLLGVIGTIAVVGTWFVFAWRTDPDHVKHVMLGAEIVERVTDQTPEGISKPFYFAAMWFVTKGGLFSLFALASVVFFARRERSWLFAAALWLIVLLVGLTVPPGKRMDYLLPTYAPAALLAATMLVALLRRIRLPIALAGLLPLAMAVVLGRANLTNFHEAREGWTDNAVAFTTAVRERVRDSEPLLVIVRGKHPLTTLLHRHPGSALRVDDLKAARWVVLPLTDTFATPVLKSELLPLGFETIETRPLGEIGLFDMRSSDVPTLDELIAAQKHVGEWTSDENPYRAPGTVWRE